MVDVPWTKHHSILSKLAQCISWLTGVQLCICEVIGRINLNFHLKDKEIEQKKLSKSKLERNKKATKNTATQRIKIEYNPIERGKK